MKTLLSFAIVIIITCIFSIILIGCKQKKESEITVKYMQVRFIDDSYKCDSIRIIGNSTMLYINEHELHWMTKIDSILIDELPVQILYRSYTRVENE